MKQLKYVLLLVLAVYSINTLLAQQQKTIYYDKSWNVITDSAKAVYYRDAVREGPNKYAVKDYYSNGSLQMTGTYTDRAYTMKADTFKFYHENGQLSAIEHYAGSQLDGIYQAYYKNGQLKSSGFYKDAARTGNWTEYYENGEIESKGLYEKGRAVGLWILNYDDGKLKSKGELHRNKKNGEWLYYHPNGQLKAQEFFNKGKIEKAQYLFANGTIQSFGGYQSKEKQGLWKYFAPDGRTIFSGYYNNGVETGNWIREFRHSEGMTISYSYGKPSNETTGFVISGFSLSESK